MERRIFVRFFMSGTVVVTPQDGQGAVDCELVDISYGGIGVHSPVNLEKESPVRFVLLNRQLNINISGSAKVSYCYPDTSGGSPSFRLGLVFADVDSAAVRKLLYQIREMPEKK